MGEKIKVIADESMPGIEPLFGDLAEIAWADGRSIDNEMLRGSDVLLCRSVTKVDRELLQNTGVKFVGTATIGTDHLDCHWLSAQNIQWANAAGCNAAAVAQYVLSAIAYWCKQSKRRFAALKVGIVGAGNVGSELARCLDLLGVRYCLYDPPLEITGDKRLMVDFDRLVKCDVITLHVPLTEHGKYATRHLFDQCRLKQLVNDQLLINASRGAIVDNRSLIENANFTNAQVVLDVFENEPDVSIALLERCLLATPHIAGHTLEGKLRGSWMIYQAFCRYFDLPEEHSERALYPPQNTISLQNNLLEEQLLSLYDIKADSSALRNRRGLAMAAHFDQLRKDAARLTNGEFRRDYSGWHYLGKHKLPL